MKLWEFRLINQCMRLPGMGLETEPSETLDLEPTQGKCVGLGNILVNKYFFK